MYIGEFQGQTTTKTLLSNDYYHRLSVHVNVIINIDII